MNPRSSKLEPRGYNLDSGLAIAKGTGGGNVLQSNFIGTNAAGTAGIANLHGIQITDWSISGTFNDDSMTQR